MDRSTQVYYYDSAWQMKGLHTVEQRTQHGAKRLRKDFFWTLDTNPSRRLLVQEERNGSQAQERHRCSEHAVVGAREEAPSTAGGGWNGESEVVEDEGGQAARRVADGVEEVKNSNSFL